MVFRLIPFYNDIQLFRLSPQPSYTRGSPTRGMGGFFEVDVRVRLSETDALGIVYYAHYLVYFDIARLELLRSRGITAEELGRRGLGFLAAQVTCRYLSPARFDDMLKVRVRVGRLGRSSVTYDHEIWRVGDRTKIATGRVVDVMVDSHGIPTTIPGDIRSRLIGEGGRPPQGV